MGGIGLVVEEVMYHVDVTSKAGRRQNRHVIVLGGLVYVSSCVVVL